MAKASGIIKLKGTIGELNFYVRKGVPTVRAAGGGFNGNAIKTSPTMMRVRENGSEFKGCMESVKCFKQGLNPYFALVKNGESHQRLASLFTQIKDADRISDRGLRNVARGMETPEGQRLLTGYVFNAGKNLLKVLGRPFDFSADEGLRVRDFSASTVLFPAGATHLELRSLVYVYDFAANKGTLETSETVIISKKDHPDGDLLLPPAALPTADGIAIGLVCHRFLQEVNDGFYSLKAESSSGLEVVFVE